MKGVTGHDFGGAFPQVLEEDLGVLFLIFRGLQKNGGNILIPRLFGFAGIIGITVPGLGLPGKSDEQIFFGLGTLQLHGRTSLVKCWGVQLLSIRWRDGTPAVIFSGWARHPWGAPPLIVNFMGYKPELS